MPADDALAAEPAPRSRRRRVVVGVVLLAVGLAIVGVVVATGDDDERPVGELVSADLPGTTAAGPSTTTTAGPIVTAPGETTAPSTAPPTPTTAAEAPADGKPAWPRAVRGRPPAFGADGDAPPTEAVDLDDGAYLWNDFSGWHLWIVGGAGDATVEVVSDDELAKAEPVGGDPALTVDVDRFTVSRGAAPAAVVGVDFNPGFYAKELTVTVTGDLPLHLGSRAELATSPAVIAKAPGA